MDDLSARHMEWLDQQGFLAANTVASRRRVLRLLPNAGTIGREEMESWYATRRMLVKPSTLGVDLSHLREFYHWCAMYEHRHDDPTIRIRLPKLENPIHRKISNDQIQRLLGQLPPDLERAVCLGAFAGLRVSESAYLDWSNIDTSEDEIIVRRSKGNKSRAVPVSPDLIRRLSTDGTTGNVVSAGGVPYSAPALQRRLNRVMRSAGAEFTSHDLRHRWGRAAYRSSLDLLAVGEMMGHSNPNTTKIYASADNEVKRKIAKAVML